MKPKSGWRVEDQGGGVYLPQVDLWMDPSQPRKRALVSHAHYDHLAKHEEILASPGTAAQLRVRAPKGTRIRVLPFGERFCLGRGMSLRLFPAGHILGSAMALVERPEGKGRKTRLLYTGDFKLRRSLTVEACLPQRADVLVMETTFGRPQFRFPPRDEVMREMISFCQGAVAEGKTPVLLAYSLGKSQEVMMGLRDCGLPFLLHPAIHRMSQIYREGGIALPEGKKFTSKSAQKAKGHVLIFPPQAARGKILAAVEPRSMGVVTGWALQRGAIYRYGCQAAFALSDHADYDELLEMVERVKPREVRTLHGYAQEFAEDLQERGQVAWACRGETQFVMDLSGKGKGKKGQKKRG